MSPTISFTPIDNIPRIHASLRATFRSGKTKPVAFRKQQLLQLWHLLEENFDRFKHALFADMGRPFEEAELFELTGCLRELKETYDNVEKWAAPEHAPFSWLWFAMSPKIRKEPKGVALLISPFNYPVYLSLCPLSGAIAAGNTALLKPSELTPATSALLAELIPKYLDPETVQVVNGGVPETTKILELPFDHILYTGNGRVGQVIAEAAAKHLTPVTLELGGRNPCVIDPRCDVKTAAKRIMWGKLVNGGQMCTAPDYVLVPAGFQDELIAALEDAYRELHPVDPRESGMMCRMVNVGHAARVKKLIDDTKGTIVFGGEVDVPAMYAAPALVKDVRPDDSLMSEEIFGPLLPVLPVKDVDEAIDLINAGDHPLNIYIFSNDAGFKEKVLDNTQSGNVFVNDVFLHIMVQGIPFGGIGASGTGYKTGKYSFDTFTHMRSLADNPNWLDTVLTFVRYTPYKKRNLWLYSAVFRPKLPGRVRAPSGVVKGIQFGFLIALASVLSVISGRMLKRLAA